MPVELARICFIDVYSDSPSASLRQMDTAMISE